MKIYRSPFILLSFILIQAYGQTQPPKIIQRLIAEKGSVKSFWQRPSNTVIRPYLPINLIPSKLRMERFYLAKNSRGLFYGIDGTGIVFRLSNSNNKIKATKVDSTYFIGNNFNAFYFTHRDSIYSYGGYGFWKTNGLLRKFDHTLGEWEALMLDKEFPSEFPSVGQIFMWSDEKENKLWLFQRAEHNVFGGDKRNFYQNIYCLDLNDHTWKDFGKTIESGHQMIFDHSDGVLRINGYKGDGEFWDFRNNRILEIDSITILNCKSLFKGVTPNLGFTIGNWIYFGNDEANTLDSFAINLPSFKVTGKEIYSENSKNEITNQDSYIILLQRNKLYIILISLLLLSIPLYRKFKLGANKRRSKNVHETLDQLHQLESDEKNIPFNELEKLLIKKINFYTKEKGSITIDDINRTLGLSSKNMAVQKKNRNEIINRINTKWEAHTGKKEVLIQKQRSIFDKRNFEYFISKKMIDDSLMQKMIDAN
jgi:hypothetical protein